MREAGNVFFVLNQLCSGGKSLKKNVVLWIFNRQESVPSNLLINVFPCFTASSAIEYDAFVFYYGLGNFVWAAEIVVFLF